MSYTAEWMDTLTADEARKLLGLLGHELDRHDAEKRVSGAALALSAAVRSFLALTEDRHFRGAWEGYCAARPELRAKAELLKFAAETFDEAFDRATEKRR